MGRMPWVAMGRMLACRTDSLGRRNANDSRKLYSRLAAADKSRQILEYLDDKKLGDNVNVRALRGTGVPWHTHMRRAFKEKLRTFATLMQPSSRVDADPLRHKCSRVLIAEACPVFSCARRLCACRRCRGIRIVKLLCRRLVTL